MNIQKDKKINKSLTGKLNTTNEFCLIFKNLPHFGLRMRYYYGVTCRFYTIVMNEPQQRGVHIIILAIGK